MATDGWKPEDDFEVTVQIPLGVFYACSLVIPHELEARDLVFSTPVHQ